MALAPYAPLAKSPVNSALEFISLNIGRHHMLLEILSHPLFIVLVGGVLTGIVIPKISRKQKNYQKELDLKTELVAEMSESVMTILITFESNLSYDEENLETEVSPFLEIPDAL